MASRKLDEYRVDRVFPRGPRGYVPDIGGHRPERREESDMADVHGHRLVGIRAATTLVDLGFPAIAAGVIARRRPVLGLLERVQADSRGAERIRALRASGADGYTSTVADRAATTVADLDRTMGVR